MAPFYDTSEKTVSLIVPVYNEEVSIEYFLQKISAVKNRIKNTRFEIVFINDGSEDNTLSVLLENKSKYENIKIIDLTRNFGKEAALSAGLNYVKGDAVIPMDVDLQDPPELIAKLIDKWREGYLMVLAKRASRKTDSFFKKYTAIAFYKVFNALSDVKMPENVGDFRLMDRKVIDAINRLPESCRFMKGIYAWVGYKYYIVEYDRAERVEGHSKFNSIKLWRFALDGMFSFSVKPIKVWAYLGFFISFISFLYAIYIVYKVLYYGIDVPGYASIFTAFTFFSGLQLVGIGILGEYLSRTYLEAKRRPIYLINNLIE